MTYRITLYEDNSIYPSLLWEIDDRLVKQRGLEDEARLAAHLLRMMRLSAADSTEVRACASAAVAGRPARLRVVVQGQAAPPSADEIAELSKQVNHLQSQLRQCRNEADRMKQRALDQESRAAKAEASATQAEIDARLARQSADDRVSAAQLNEAAIQKKLNETSSELTAAKREARRLQERLDEAEAQIDQLRTWGR